MTNLLKLGSEWIELKQTRHKSGRPTDFPLRAMKTVKNVDRSLYLTLKQLMELLMKGDHPDL